MKMPMAVNCLRKPSPISRVHDYVADIPKMFEYCKVVEKDEDPKTWSRNAARGILGGRRTVFSRAMDNHILEESVKVSRWLHTLWVCQNARKLPRTSLFTLIDEYMELVPRIGIGAEEFSYFKQGVITASIGMCLVFSWASAGKQSYLVSPELSQMLHHTKLDNLPMETLRLPYPVVEFEFMGNGARFEEYQASSILVQLADEPGSLHLTSWATVKNNPMPLRMVHTMGSPLKDYSTVKAYARGISSSYSAEDAHGASDILKYAIALMVYISSIDADTVLASESPEYAAWCETMSRSKKRKTKRERNALKVSVPPHRYVIGHSLKVINRHHYEEKRAVAGGGTHASPCAHWRAGHFRSVWCGPLTGERTLETRWIKPTIVNLAKSDGVTPTNKTLVE